MTQFIPFNIDKNKYEQRNEKKKIFRFTIITYYKKEENVLKIDRQQSAAYFSRENRANKCVLFLKNKSRDFMKLIIKEIN